MKEWRTAWSYQTIELQAQPMKFSDETQRISIRNNLTGNQIRLHVSNRYGIEPLSLERVALAKGTKECIFKESSKEVSFDGEPRVTLMPGEERYSDPVIFSIQKGDNLLISSYLRDTVTLTCGCTFYSRAITNVQNSFHGDCTGEEKFMPRPQSDYITCVRNNEKYTYLYGFDGIDILVDTDQGVKTWVAFGDSITHQSYWTGALSKNLYEGSPNEISIVNCGIGGNRILHKTAETAHIFNHYGDAGIDRFENDVFGNTPVDGIMVLEGINDLVHPGMRAPMEETVSAGEIVEGLKVYARIAHEHHKKILAGTLLPCGGADCYTKEAEEKRQTINAWIRKNKEYDGYLDFDAMVRNKCRPVYLDPSCDSGDHLHPSEMGGELMARAVAWEELLD